MDIRNARTRLVHVDNELDAKPRLIVCESIGFHIGDKVLFQQNHGGRWAVGHVDHRAPSGPGGVIMVTSEP